jgi:hypothetical protein
MPRKPKQAPGPLPGQTLHLHVGGAASNDDEDNFEALDSQEGGALSAAIETLRSAGGVTVEVYRIAPPDRIGFCQTYPAAAFTIEKIAQAWGPGTYRAKFKDPDQRYMKAGNLKFDIAGGILPLPGAPGGSLQDMLALLKTEREREVEARSKAKGEAMEWAKLIVPLALPKLLELFVGSRSNLTDMIRAVKDLKDLQAPAADLNTQFGQVVDILKGAKELVGDAPTQTGSTWVDLVRDFLQSPAMDAIAKGMIPGAIRPQLQQPPGVIRVQPPPQLPPAIQAAPPPASTAKPDPNMLEQLNWLKAVLADLLVQAAKNSNPRLYAEVVLDNLPPFIAARDLMEKLAAENWWAQLTVVEQRVTQHQEWFTKFRDTAVKLLLRRERRAVESTLSDTPIHVESPSGSPGGAPPGEGGPDPNQLHTEPSSYE